MSSVFDGNERSGSPEGNSRTTNNLSSLPTDENDEFGGETFLVTDLLDKLDVDDIIELRNYFIRGIAAVSLTKSEFVSALQKVFGDVGIATAAAKLFHTFDVKSSGKVSWDQVLDGILEKIKNDTDDIGQFWKPILPQIKIYSALHCKREPIVKIVSLETKSSFCYAIVSRLGRVGVYDGDLNLLDSYKLALKPSDESALNFGREKEEKQRRSQTTWIADAVYISDGNALLYASSDRGLHLYDANSLSHIPVCRIIGLPNVPTCMEYFASDEIGKPSLLFIGDDVGNVITMKFHQAQSSLFKKRHPDKLDIYYWSELTEQTDYVTYSSQTSIHNDAIIQITFCCYNDTLLTCSNDSNNTLVIRHIDGRREPYVFKVTRGIKCFHYERSMHLIATGSNDFVVRLWNEVVTKQPVISLYGHKAPLVDVRIIKFMSSVMSLSREGVVKMWDVNDYYCKMTLPVQFPILKVIGARIDFGVRSLYPGPKTVREVSADAPGTRSESRSTFATGISPNEVETKKKSETNLTKREESQWKRRNVLAACSNLVAVLTLVPLTFDPVENDPSQMDGAYLPPPAKEHYASAPSPWKIAESYTKTPSGSEESNSTGRSSASSPAFSPKMTTDFQSKKKPFKNLQNFTGDKVKSPVANMNAKRTEYVIRQEQMKMLVEQCAPHLALDLHELEPIKFSKPLPLTRSMKERGIDVSDPERVVKAKLPRDPTLLSLGSSSAAQTPRSSKSSKSTGFPRKKFIPHRAPFTPDWFIENIHSNRLASPGTTS